MKIEGLIWHQHIVEKIGDKHRVDTQQVEDVFKNKPLFLFVEKGRRKGENVYMALGQSDAGRYLAVLFIYKQTREALILSARDMADKERKRYAKI